MSNSKKKKIGITIILFEILGGFLLGFGLRPYFISETTNIIYPFIEEKDAFELKLREELTNVSFNIEIDRIVVNDSIVILSPNFFDYFKFSCGFYDYSEGYDVFQLWIPFYPVNFSQFLLNEIRFETFSLVFSNGYEEDNSWILEAYFLDGELEDLILFVEFDYKNVFDGIKYYDVSGQFCFFYDEFPYSEEEEN